MVVAIDELHLVFQFEIGLSRKENMSVSELCSSQPDLAAD